MSGTYRALELAHGWPHDDALGHYLGQKLSLWDVLTGDECSVILYTPVIHLPDNSTPHR